MRRAWVNLSVGMFVLALFFMSGCKQLEGERCQMDSDCEEGYICCEKGVADICLPKDKCNVPDAGTDAGIEAGAEAGAEAPPWRLPPWVTPPWYKCNVPDAGTDAGAEAGTEAGIDAKVDAPIIDKSVTPDKMFTPDTKPVVDSTPMDSKAPAKE